MVLVITVMAWFSTYRILLWYDHPAQDDIVGNAGESHGIFAQKIKKTKEIDLALLAAGTWLLDCSIHVLY